MGSDATTHLNLSIIGCMLFIQVWLRGEGWGYVARVVVKVSKRHCAFIILKRSEQIRQFISLSLNEFFFLSLSFWRDFSMSHQLIESIVFLKLQFICDELMTDEWMTAYMSLFTYDIMSLILYVISILGTSDRSIFFIPWIY